MLRFLILLRSLIYLGTLWLALDFTLEALHLFTTLLERQGIDHSMNLATGLTIFILVDSLAVYRERSEWLDALNTVSVDINSDTPLGRKVSQLTDPMVTDGSFKTRVVAITPGT